MKTFSKKYFAFEDVDISPLPLLPWESIDNYELSRRLPLEALRIPINDRLEKMRRI